MRRLRHWLARAIEETGAFFWSRWRQCVRNPWRRAVTFRGQDCDPCYWCTLVFPSRRMSAYCTNDGDEHRLCDECTAFSRLLSLAHKAGAL